MQTQEPTTGKLTYVTVLALAIALHAGPSPLKGAQMPKQKQFANSIGMKFVRINPGTFRMGQLKTPLPPEVLPVFRGRGLFDTLNEGDYDEKPTHTVKITRPFYIGGYEVTNFQYELFDPDHKKLRGKNDFSKNDDEAVAFVNWYDAQAFCCWLSDKEGLPYRLPTEAEWEYACRAGTTTNFHTGDVLPEAFLKKVSKGGGTTKPVDLTVGRTPPSVWGVYDMHGNLEEWCYDWYGPYKQGKQADPVGYARGDFKVTRGGSHGTEIYYLRSANRMGAIPESRNWVTGFRAVIGHLPGTEPLPTRVPRNQQDVVERDPTAVTKGPDPDKPYFKGPLRYVNMATSSTGPVFACHNHVPAIAECPNGDLLACWYTCHDEQGRELIQAASRLRWCADKWEQASWFFGVPDRNNHSPAMWFDGRKTIYHFTAVSADKSRGRSVLAMRTSSDSGATWSGPRIIQPEFSDGHLPSEPVFRMHNGNIVFAVDGPDTLWMSKDEGLTWFNPGGDIPGIHAGVTQLSDGRLFALSRNAAIDGKMAVSISSDGGKTFTNKASEFFPVGGGQRLALLRLREGQLFLASFTPEGGDQGLMITDSSGTRREVKGLFAALSEDDGRSWPYKRLVTDDGGARTIECTDGAAITMSARHAEYRGYLSACQSLDRLIHVISSRNHYTFNLKWLKTAPPPPCDEPVRVKAAVETFTGPDDFDLDDWHDYKGGLCSFNNQGQYTIKSGSHYNGINRLVGAGSFEATFSVKNIHYNPPGEKISEGITLGFKNPLSGGVGTMFVWIKQNEITTRGLGSVQLDKPPKVAKIKFIYDELTLRWRIFYGIDGQEPLTEFPKSRSGVYMKAGTNESIAAYILMSNGTVGLDHFEIKPLSGNPQIR